MAERYGFALVLALAACAETVPLPEGPPAFVTDVGHRRRTLETSLVDPTNGYSAVRLANYGLGDSGWDLLEVFDPPVTPLGEGDRATAAEGLDWDHDTLIAIGRRAFERYPLSPAGALSADDPGLWRDDRGRTGGLVETDDGARFKTCATCHARADDGEPLVYGASNTRLDLGRSSYDEAVLGGALPTSVASYLEWGPGHVDPTADGIANPTGITDLRPIRHQSHLNVAASVINDLDALAVRIETLMITSAGARHRPPREIAYAIAYFLWSLGDGQPTGEHPAGQQVFERTCAGCHRADYTTAPPIPLDVVGTDPLAGQSTMRGTGHYRIPSLYRVGDRRRLLHRGQVNSLEDLLDSERAEPGHPFGWDTSETERADLVAFLRTL